MVRINITFVILFSIVNCPSCHAKCESYYIIMEKNIDDFAYNLIKKDNITWSISNIHTNKETNTFDMSCVLNLHCEKSAIEIKKNRTPIFRFGEDVHEPVKDHIIKEVNKTNITKVPSEPKKNENITSSEEKLDNNKTLTGKEYYESLDIDSKKTNSSMQGSEFASANGNFTSGKNNSDTVTTDKININSQEVEISIGNNTKTTDLENSELNIENGTESTNLEDIEKNKEVDEGKNVTDAENRTIKIVKKGIGSNNTESSEVNLEKVIETTNDDHEVNQQDNTNSTDDTNNKVNNKNDTMASTNETIIFGRDLHKYNPEESRKMAYKVMAGTLGAVCAVGVFLLVKFGASKLIDHFTQYGVYRIPNP